MAAIYYIPSYSERVALTKLQIVGKDIPFYWREAEAAHDMAARHYPGGKVYAVSVGPDGRLMAREHALGSDPSIADSGVIETCGSIIAALLIVCAGPFAVGLATLF